MSNTSAIESLSSANIYRHISSYIVVVFKWETSIQTGESAIKRLISSHFGVILFALPKSDLLRLEDNQLLKRIERSIRLLSSNCFRRANFYD